MTQQHTGQVHRLSAEGRRTGDLSLSSFLHFFLSFFLFFIIIFFLFLFLLLSLSIAKAQAQPPLRSQYTRELSTIARARRSTKEDDAVLRNEQETMAEQKTVWMHEQMPGAEEEEEEKEKEKR